MLIPNGQNKERKYRCAIFIKENCNNTAAWQIDNGKKLLTEIDKDLNKVLIMILNKCNIYSKYLNQANYTNKQCKKIRNISLSLEQKL